MQFSGALQNDNGILNIAFNVKHYNINGEVSMNTIFCRLFGALL
jgi:hypothetical protein